MRALTPRQAFAASLSLLRARPLPTLALGAALTTSLLSVACGVGAFAAAWFLCELFALQIAIGTGEPTRRTRAWLWAGAVQALAVLVLSSVLGLCMLAIGPDIWLGGLHATRGVMQQVGASVALLALAGGLAVMLTVCFEHAPAILVDRGGGLIAAMMESARLVTESGTLRTWSTSVIAHGIQMLPLVLGFTLASVVASLASLPWWALALGPFAVVCLVVGQGMVVAAYLALRAEVTDPRSVPVHASPSKLGTALWSGLLLATLLGPLCVAGALARPSQLQPGALEGQIELSIEAPKSGTVQRYIQDTALTVKVSARSVRVIASDGGGVGKLSLPTAPIARVRVARVGAASDGAPIHAVEAEISDGRVFVTHVDAAGVRLDDSATRRLSLLLPSSAYLVLALCLAWTATWFVRALPPQARLRRRLALNLGIQHDAAAMPELLRAFRRRWVVSAIWLVPAALSSLGIGMWAVLGWRP
jgi:hypothetical protein